MHRPSEDQSSRPPASTPGVGTTRAQTPEAEAASASSPSGQRQETHADSSPPTDPSSPAKVRQGPSFSGFTRFPAEFGRYRVLKPLGHGGMASVFLAEDTSLERQVALKVPYLGRDEETALERFAREARAASSLNHPHICPIFDVGEIDGCPYLSMAYIEGRTLSDCLKQSQAFPPRTIALLVRALALAMAEAHRKGIIHRDLKPSNIMLNQRAEPVIMDFGLARRSSTADVRLTATGAVLGTPGYMPPEQVQGNPEAMGPHSDIYSLGVILYELLCGRRPFDGPLGVVLAGILREPAPPPSSFRDGVDADLEGICLKAMAKKPAERHTSMAALASELAAYLGAEDTDPAEILPTTACLENPASPRTLHSTASRPTLSTRSGTRHNPNTPAPRQSRATAKDAAPQARRGSRRLLWFGAAGVFLGGVLAVVFGISGIGTRNASPTAFQAAAGPSPPVPTGVDRGTAPTQPSRPIDEPNPASGVQALLDRAREQQRKHQLEQAIGSYSEAIRLNPQSAEAFAGRAACRAERREDSRAIADCNQALQLDPNLAAAFATRAYAHGRMGEREKAQDDIAAALRLDPKSALAHVYQSWLFGLNRDWARAFAAYDTAVKLDSKFAPLYYFRGETYSQNRETDKAITDYDKAIDLDPTYVMAWVGRGRARYRQNAHKLALADFSEAIRLDSQELMAYLRRGETYLALHDTDRAAVDLGDVIRIATRFIQESPDSFAPYYWRGWAHQLNQKYDAAIADCNRAIERAPRYVGAWNDRGRAYRLKKDYDKAVADYTEAIKLNPNYALAYFNRGYVYEVKKDHSRAIADYTEAIRLDPKYALAYFNRGYNYGEQKEYAKAIADYTEAIRWDPNYAPAHANRGAAYANKGDDEHAIADYTRALQLQPTARTYANRAAAYGRINKIEAALADFSQAIRLDPKYTWALNKRGNLYLQQRNYGLAIEDYTKAFQLEPTNAMYICNRGNAYRQQREYDRALADCTEAIRVDPKYARGYYIRALTYKDKGDAAQAKKEYEKARQLDPNVGPEP